MSKTPKTDAIYNSIGGDEICVESDWGKFVEHARQLERKLNEANEKLKQAHRDFGYELRDPAGTIWDECKRLQEELNEARKDAARLDWLLENTAGGQYPYIISGNGGEIYHGTRKAIDKAMEAEQS